MYFISNFECSAHLFNVFVWADLRRCSKRCNSKHRMIWKALLTRNRLNVDVMIKRVKYWCIFNDIHTMLLSYRLDGPGLIPGKGKIFLYSTASRSALGLTHPPIQWVPGALSPGVMRQGCKADYSPPTSANVRVRWSCTSTPPYMFMA
jgi:hypothetical protein